MLLTKTANTNYYYASNNNYQKEYFLAGDEKNKTNDSKDIANEIDMDISTISRVANSKYVDTPYGTKLLKNSLANRWKQQIWEISTIEIKKILEKIISDENKRKPETDEKLVRCWKGYEWQEGHGKIEQLNIPAQDSKKCVLAV